MLGSSGFRRTLCGLDVGVFGESVLVGVVLAAGDDVPGGDARVEDEDLGRPFCSDA